MATKRKITRKVISREIKQSAQQPRPAAVSGQPADGSSRLERSKRVCIFCQNKSAPSYTDLASLRRFLTDRAKIVSRERSGICSKHQRAVAKNIKYARHLALLPFVPKV